MTIAGGFAFNVYLDGEGAVWTAGLNGCGQLGHGDSQTRMSAMCVEELPPCMCVATGRDHVAAVSRDGRLFCWGRGNNGQLGSQKQVSLRPRHVTGLPPIQSVACGYYFTMALAQDGTVWAFGANDWGQLGLDHLIDVSTPTQVPNITAEQIACGISHTAILSDGQLYVCGLNDYGQLGHPFAHSQLTTPTRVEFDAPIRMVRCGAKFTVIVAADHSVWTTGENYHGELGTGGNWNRDEWMQVECAPAKYVCCGWYHTMLLDFRDQLWGWGQSLNNALGREKSEFPVLIMEDVSMVQTGAHCSIVRKNNDQIFVCGDNEGQLWLGHDVFPQPWTENPKISPEMLPIPLASRLKSAVYPND